jgi:hypothetical protein
MSHWLWVAMVIEATALASWIAAAATQQTKVAFVFGFNLMAPVAGLHLTAGGEFGWRSAVAAVQPTPFAMTRGGRLAVGRSAVGRGGGEPRSPAAGGGLFAIHVARRLIRQNRIEVRADEPDVESRRV